MSQEITKSSVSHVRANRIREFMTFLQTSQDRLRKEMVLEENVDVQRIRAVVEEHYVDDQGKPAMYQRFESVLYDDSRTMVTLWSIFDGYEKHQLQSFEQLLQVEVDGLTGDRHPKHVFDRSIFGKAAIVIAVITVWMGVLKTFTGDNLGDLMIFSEFDWVGGLILVGGLFVVLWYVLKTFRNNKQVALMSTLFRALKVYLYDPI